jgi:hypothetical protein
MVIAAVTLESTGVGQFTLIPLPAEPTVPPPGTEADFRDETPALTDRQLADLARFQSETVSRVLGLNMKTDGAVPRAFRTRNPLQLINPFAPPEYGSSFDNVTTDLLTDRPDGIRILGVKF